MDEYTPTIIAIDIKDFIFIYFESPHTAWQGRICSLCMLSEYMKPPLAEFYVDTDCEYIIISYLGN